MECKEVWVIADKQETARLFIQTCTGSYPASYPSHAEQYYLQGWVHHLIGKSGTFIFFRGFESSLFHSICEQNSEEPDIRKACGLVFIDSSQNDSQFDEFLRTSSSRKHTPGDVNIRQLPLLLVSTMNVPGSTQSQYSEIPRLCILSLSSNDKGARDAILQVG
jgi:hypothetical protein